MIHVEQLWTENLLTIQDHAMHEPVHEGRRASLGGVRIESRVPLCSMRQGLLGKALGKHPIGQIWAKLTFTPPPGAP